MICLCRDKLDSGRAKRGDLRDRLPKGTLLWDLSVVVGALLCFAWLAYAMRVGETANFDEQLRSWVHQFASPPLTALMKTITILGASVVLWGVGVGVVLALLRRGGRRAAALLLVTLGGAELLMRLLKWSFQRPRPHPFFDLPIPSSYSFPSGHALMSFCFYGTLTAVLTARIPSRTTRLGLWVATTLLVGLIGLSRVYLGVHYPSDVLAGYAAALVWVLTVVWGDRMLQRQ